MKLYVGVTDNDWYRFLSKLANVDEVNFCQPGGRHFDNGGSWRRYLSLMAELFVVGENGVLGCIHGGRRLVFDLAITEDHPGSDE